MLLPMTRETDKRTSRDRRSNSDHRVQLPPSVSDNIETIADFYARNEQHLTLSQAIIEKCSTVLGSPGYVTGSLLFVV
jgi:uncharacterized membrane protein